jgi:hypothetical protein
LSAELAGLPGDRAGLATSGTGVLEVVAALSCLVVCRAHDSCASIFAASSSRDSDLSSGPVARPLVLALRAVPVGVAADHVVGVGADESGYVMVPAGCAVSVHAGHGPLRRWLVSCPFWVSSGSFSLAAVRASL